ncbi:MAG: flagellar motor protein MotB [Desulfobacterales bacterium]|nr:flagellar motor protein MotB [Desulfobacterales bacterium]
MGDEAITNGAAKDKGAPKWVVTFGDLMSLLLCFFVLLLSFSEMDRQKYKVVAGSMAEAFGVQRKERVFESPRGAKMVALAFDQDMAPKYDREEYIATQVMESLGEELKEALEGKLRGLEDQVEIEVEGNQTIIRLLGGATFDSGQARIRPRLIPILKEIGSRLKSTEGDIIIAGHTDNVPVRGGPFESNLKLSIARAAEVAEFMIDRVAIPPQRISTMGFGKYRPAHSNASPEGREKNRRVEIILTAKPQPGNTILESIPPWN